MYRHKRGMKRRDNSHGRPAMTVGHSNIGLIKCELIDDEANRQVLYQQTCNDIDTWMSDLEKQMVTGGTGEDLASVNILIQKQQMIETQMAIKAQQVSEMGAQAEYLERMTAEKVEDVKQKKEAVERRFDELKAQLVRRQRDLEKKKEVYQFRRDVEDEKLWISERMPLATDSDNGNSLFNVNVLKKNNQSLRTVSDNHEQRIRLVCNNGQKLIDENHADSEEFSNLIEELLDTWQTLNDAMDNRRAKLLASERVQQYFFDASEAESWMSEQELYMMDEDHGTDEISAQNLMKKHKTLELAVEDYAETIRSLGETSTQLIAEGHQNSDRIAVRQAQVDKLYAWLRGLAKKLVAELEEALQLFMLRREVDDLLQWIADRKVVAGSHELGVDYDDVTLLWERFKEFARNTETIGTERVAAVQDIADQLMGARHSDVAIIAEWKDDLNEDWSDLLELIDTRTQMLAASREQLSGAAAGRAAIRPAGRGILLQQPEVAAAIRPNGLAILHQLQAAAAIQQAGRAIPHQPPAIAAAIRQADAAIAPPVGGGQPLPQLYAAAIGPPVGGYLTTHLQVTNDLFVFLTGTIGTAAITRNFEVEEGYKTTVEVPGDDFVAVLRTADNLVDRNKREASTIFVNHLIALGVVILNGRRITTGPNVPEYVQGLDMESKGFYNVHNARCIVESKLGNRLYCLEDGGPGRYRCSLQFPNFGRDKICVDVLEKRKQDAANFAFYQFSQKLFAAGKIDPALRTAGPEPMPLLPTGHQPMQERHAGPQVMQPRPAGLQPMQERHAGPQVMQPRPAGPPNAQQQRQPGPGQQAMRPAQQQRPAMPYPAGMPQRPGH